MKRTKILILALLVALAAVPSLHAQDYVIGSSIYPEEVADGMEVVFEGRSVTTSRGSYLGPFKDLDPADIGNLPKLIRPGSDEVPLEIVWVLHLADEPNAVTGEAQYYLQNKETGEYIATGSFDNDPNTRANRLHMVDDIAEAAPFCFHYSSEGEPYGSVNYGSLSTPIDWIDDPTCITILCIDESIPNGRAFISNEESGTTCSYFEYLDTNVWNIHRYYVPSGARDWLQIYLDNLPANWEGEYAYGTDPGFINNEEKVIQYTELVFNAINNIATMSDEECKATYDEIMELVEFFDDPANSVQIKDGGYYYITAGYDAFQQSGKTNYGWYGPINYMDQVGWKEIEPTGAFIWKFTQVADSAYMIENLGCGLYADSTLYNAHLEVLYMSDLPACQQFVTKLNHAGNYRIQWDGGVQAYHQMDHGNGEGTGSTIVLHDQDGNTSPSTWILRKVPEDVLQQVLSTLNHDRLELYLSQNTDLLDKYTVGNRIGQLNNQAIYDEIKAAYETAVAEVGNQHTEDHGPHEQQDHGNDDGNQTGDNGHAALAAEEGQPVRQLGVLELVVAQTGDQTSQDADEGVGNLGESHIVGAGGGDNTLSVHGQHERSHGTNSSSAQQVGDHQPGHQTSQASGAFLIVGHTNGNADGEQDGHVVDQSATGLDQEETDGIAQTRSSIAQGLSHSAAHHVGGAEPVTDTHQNTTDGQHGHGQHQGFAETL